MRLKLLISKSSLSLSDSIYQPVISDINKAAMKRIESASPFFFFLSMNGGTGVAYSISCQLAKAMTPASFAKTVVKQTLYSSPPRWIWAGTGAYPLSWVVSIHSRIQLVITPEVLWCGLNSWPCSRKASWFVKKFLYIYARALADLGLSSSATRTISQTLY